MNNSNSFAEVLVSNLTTIQAQCWNWKQPPIFGSLVTIKNNDQSVFAIISNILIESSDPIRKPIAYKKTEAELLEEQPQIFEFLETNFTAIIVGTQKEDRILYHLPSAPPQIHSFVSYPTQEEAQSFFKKSDFLYLLTEQIQETPNFHELLFAIIKSIKEQNLLNLNEISELLKIITTMLKADYTVIKTFVNRVELLLQ